MNHSAFTHIPIRSGFVVKKAQSTNFIAGSILVIIKKRNKQDCVLYIYGHADTRKKAHIVNFSSNQYAHTYSTFRLITCVENFYNLLDCAHLNHGEILGRA